MKFNFLLKALTHGDDYRICGDCANELCGIWPKGHKATFGGGTCHFCQKPKLVCALSDYHWPESWPNALKREF